MPCYPAHLETAVAGGPGDTNGKRRRRIEDTQENELCVNTIFIYVPGSLLFQ